MPQRVRWVKDLKWNFFPDVWLGFMLLVGVWKAWRAIGLAFGDIRRMLEDVVFMYYLSNPSLHNESGDLESVVSKVYFMFSGPVVGPHCLYTYRLGNVIF